MRILFTAPRFHTNQAPIVAGLVNKGHEVRYFVAYTGANESHKDCEPIKLKMSQSMRWEMRKKQKHMTQSQAESYISAHFIPDYRDLRQKFDEYSPQLVICRENTPLTLYVHSLCKHGNIPCVLYDQESYYSFPDSVTKDVQNQNSNTLLKRIEIKMYRMINPDLRRMTVLRKTSGFPNVRITPVLMSRYRADISNATPKARSYFLPFISSSVPDVANREYAPDGTLRILCVSKYREYKNIPLLIEAISLLKVKTGLFVTILGQCTHPDEQDYYEKIKQMICEKQLEDRIVLQKNASHNDMRRVYLSHDVLVLPTKKEYASISVLEAMAHGLAVISTDYNGTASYIEPGKNGYIFKTENAMDLARQIEHYLQDVDVSVHGRMSARIMQDKYSFPNYYEAFTEMIEHEFGGICGHEHN